MKETGGKMNIFKVVYSEFCGFFGRMADKRAGIATLWLAS